MFIKGQSGNPAGMKKGTKTTPAKDLKFTIDKYNLESFKELINLLPKIKDPYRQFSARMELLKMTISAPKPSEVNIQINNISATAKLLSKYSEEVQEFEEFEESESETE